jgi:tetratricopeptide (TPR) repeat protein
VDRLKAIGPDLGETHLASGYYAYWGQLDYPRALEEFRAAHALLPSSTDALEGTSYVLRRQGRLEEAADQIAKWLELDPRNPLALFQNGATCLRLRRYEESDRSYRLATALNPRFGVAWAHRAWVHVRWRGDTEKAASILAEARQVVGLEDGTGEVASNSFRVGMLRREPREALQRLDGERRDVFSNQFYFLPVDLLRGEAHALAGESEKSRRAYEGARRLLEPLVAKTPEDSRLHASLGVALAGLGLHEEALREATRGTELMPVTKDALRASARLEDLARVETMVGRHEEAIARFEPLITGTGGSTSVNLLRLDPRWDPLRSNPRFQALLAKYEGRP